MREKKGFWESCQGILHILHSVLLRDWLSDSAYVMDSSEDLDVHGMQFKTTLTRLSKLSDNQFLTELRFGLRI